MREMGNGFLSEASEAKTQLGQSTAIAGMRFGWVVGGLFRCAEDVFASGTLQVVQDLPV